MAFEVQIGLGACVVVHLGVRAAQHMAEGGAGVEPHFQDVGALGVVRRVFGAQDFFGRHAAPGLDAALFDDVGGLVHDFHGARMQLARILVQKERDGHAPAALARDAPVRPPGDHVVQAGLAVFGVEAGVLDGVERDLAQRLGGLHACFSEHAFAFVHADEPLGSRAVDHGRLVAPAVRVAVRDVLGGHQAACVAQGLDDDGHGLPDVLAAKQREVGRVGAVALHRVQDFVQCHAVRAAGVEVFQPIRRRRVHDTRAVIGRGVVGQVHGRQAAVAEAAVFAGHVVQRVFKFEAAQVLAQGGGQHAAGKAVALQARGHQRLGHEQDAFARVHQRVGDFGVQVQGLVGRDGPGSSGPDDHERVLGQCRQTKGGRQLGRVVRLERHVQRGTLLVLVFDLELGQRRAAVKAPVHRLEAPVHKAALHHALERADFARLVGGIHGLVGVVPFAQHAQALEVHHLLRDLLGGKRTALGLHVVATQVAAVFLLDGVFDRQAVAVPTGHVQRVKAFELARLGDHVLEDLVDRMAHVDLAVGVGRAVVQDELGRAPASVAQALVDAFVFPVLHPTWLALGQVAAHGEGGVGQVQGAAVIRGSGGGRAGVVGHEGALKRGIPGQARSNAGKQGAKRERCRACRAGAAQAAP